MVFGLGKKKTRVTPEEFSNALWEWCKKFYVSFNDDFLPVAEKAGFPINEEQEYEFAQEIFIINLWLISKVLGEERQSLEHLHKCYFLWCTSGYEDQQEKVAEYRQAQEQLKDRYTRYYKAWDSNTTGQQAILALEILECMLNEGKPDRKLINDTLSFFVNTHVLLSMKTVLEFRQGFEISQGGGTD